MSGIEKILSGIEVEGATAAQRIIDEATAKAAQIEERSRRDAEAFLEAGKKKADDKCAAAKLNADSAAALKVRNAALSCRAALIDAVINDAVNQIASLSDGEYFARLICLAKNNARKGKGILRLCASDLKRDLSDFEKELNALDISLDKTPADIENGFILIYGDIEITAELCALVREKREQLTDTVNGILFAE